MFFVLLVLLCHLVVCGRDPQNLPAMDSNGLSDPMVKLVVGSDERLTAHIDSTLDPKWNETFVYENFNIETVMLFKVYDWNKWAQNTKMGQQGSIF